MQLQTLYPRLEELNTTAIAISQEDTDLASFRKMPDRFEGLFPILADLERQRTKSLDRTTAYVVDEQGIVRQIFPMIIHARPSWEVVLTELEGL